MLYLCMAQTRTDRPGYHQKWYLENKERVKENGRKWQAANRERHAEKAREYRRRHPSKAKARGAVSSAVYDGRMIKPDSCCKCGIQCNLEAHHHRGYDKQFHLDVILVCKPCHVLLDAEQVRPLLV